MVTRYKTAVIYKITNHKGKVYIGSTINIKKRLGDYKNLRCKQQTKLYNSIKKYGWSSHKTDLICICQDKDKYLFEAVYGIIFKVLDKSGLNIRLPKISDNYESISLEGRKRIGEMHKGKTISPKQKYQMFMNLKRYREIHGHNLIGKTPWNKGKTFLCGESNPMFGIIRSEDWKTAHSERAKLVNLRGSDHPKSKIVFDSYTGIYYGALKEVSETFNIKYTTIKSKMQRGNERFKYIY